MLDVLTIGTATKDAFLKSGSFRILSTKDKISDTRLECVPFGSKMEVEEIVFSPGGGAVNAAVTFKRQGFSTGIMARVGADPDGDTIRQMLLREGIDTAHLFIDRHLPTASSFILLHGSGERSILVHHGAGGAWDEGEVRRSRPLARWFYISSVSGNARVLKDILDSAKKNNIRIAINPGWKEITMPAQFASLFKSADILMMNKREAARFTGIDESREKEIFRRISELNPKLFVLTDGRHGSAVSDGRNIYRAGIFQEKHMEDRTGTGDAFGSGFVSGLMHRLGTDMEKKIQTEDIVYALRLGSANAAAKVEGIGATFGLLTKHQFDMNMGWQKLSIHIEGLS